MSLLMSFVSFLNRPVFAVTSRSVFPPSRDLSVPINFVYVPSRCMSVPSRSMYAPKEFMSVPSPFLRCYVPSICLPLSDVGFSGQLR
jgi:hypothetical protein